MRKKYHYMLTVEKIVSKGNENNYVIEKLFFYSWKKAAKWASQHAEENKVKFKLEWTNVNPNKEKPELSYKRTQCKGKLLYTIWRFKFEDD